jgi:chemotaxis protein MotA
MNSQTMGLFGSGLSKTDFADLLAMLYQIFRVSQQSGVMALEEHFEHPEQSAILSRYPKFLARHHSVAFLSDSFKVIIVGGMAPHDLEALMEEDLQVHHDEERGPAAALTKVADALPGLGIVAAVLGIVITMQAIDGPPAEIGHHVGAALVGTFLGILMSYGFAQPIATGMEQRVQDDGRYELCMKVGILATFKGLPPAIAVEFARRVLPHEVRPSFEETEKLCRASRGDAQAAAA